MLGRSRATEAMGRDKVTRLLFKFSIPSVIANLVSASYNLIDSIFIGKLGAASLAAVSISNPLMFIFNAIGMGTGVGASSLIGRYLGARKNAEANRVAAVAITSFFILGAICTIIFLLTLDPILRLFGADETVLPLAKSYMYVETAFIVVNFLHLTLCEIVRAEGKPVTASTALIVAGIGNCIWDPILGYGLGPFPKMGMAGFALATSIGRGMGILILLYHFARRSSFKFTVGSFVPDLKIIKDIYSVGISTMVRMAGGSFSQIIANLQAEKFGVIPVALLGVLFRLSSVAGGPCLGIGQGMLPLVAYNYGARQLRRMGEIVIKSIIFAFSWCAVCWAMALLIPVQICSIFNTEPQFLNQGATAVRIFSLAFCTVGVQMVMGYFFQGIGKGRPALILGAARQIIFLIPCLLILPFLFGIQGLWASFATADILALIFSVIMTRKEFRELGIRINWRYQEKEPSQITS
jgi:putative MATE family efflux protein